MAGWSDPPKKHLIQTHQLPASTFLEVILCATNVYFRNCGAASLLVALVVEKARRAKCFRAAPRVCGFYFRQIFPVADVGLGLMVTVGHSPRR